MVDLTNLERNNPDYFAVEVMDEAFFSGGFSARLTEAIRTKRGLAYSAGGGFSAPFDHPGTFVVVAGTKSTSAVETVQAMRDAIQEDLKKPATEDELKRAKDSILNSFRAHGAPGWPLPAHRAGCARQRCPSAGSLRRAP